MTVRSRRLIGNAGLSRKQYWFLVRRGYDRPTIQHWTMQVASREISNIYREDAAAQAGHTKLDAEFTAIVSNVSREVNDDG